MPAYDLALELGADYIEQDLQMTSDGILVVSDARSEPRPHRTGPAENCTGLVISKTLEQIKTCDVGSWFNEEFPTWRAMSTWGSRSRRSRKCSSAMGRRSATTSRRRRRQPLRVWRRNCSGCSTSTDCETPATRKWQVLIQSFQPESLLKFHAMDPGSSADPTRFHGRSRGPRGDLRVRGRRRPVVRRHRRGVRREGAFALPRGSPVHGQRTGGHPAADRHRRGRDVLELPRRRA